MDGGWELEIAGRSGGSLVEEVRRLLAEGERDDGLRDLFGPLAGFGGEMELCLILSEGEGGETLIWTSEQLGPGAEESAAAALEAMGPGARAFVCGGGSSRRWGSPRAWGSGRRSARADRISRSCRGGGRGRGSARESGAAFAAGAPGR